MQWGDELILIHENIIGYDENGFAIFGPEKRTAVFANVHSVGFSEFYKAQQSGYSTLLKVDVHTEEYGRQTLAEMSGKRYRILRTYTNPKSNGEVTELTLSDLSKGGGGVG